ncbi:quinolinate synthase NadA [candidate division WOR-3 bacterium]|nr:quinolinate synthase NadA [candidate division WOR-3 bacterium]
MDYAEKIKVLKDEKNAVILVHNYQRGEVQEIADYLGDSLELSRKANSTDAEIIVFCGVKFMAETAKILSPEKKVIMPREEAGCPMANMITPDDVLNLRKKHPNAKVVSYVNTNADVKAVTDVCCTSANAVKVVENIESDEIIFIPDRNLGSYVKRFVDKKIILWDGFCYVHEQIQKDEVLQAKNRLPEALLLVHPECRPEVIDIADKVLSTSGMIKFAKESLAKSFLIGTEEGIIYRLKKENPNKEFYSAGTPKICSNMKLTRLEDVYIALKEEKYEITLPNDIISASRKALKEMLRYV